MPIAGAAVSRLWNEYVQRYHYLGYTAMSGSQLRYNVYAGDQLVALLSFGASAWKLAGRDSFIGWQSAQRLKNLQLVVNNARFLILPWIQCKGLASKILSKVNHQLPIDWQPRYGFKPVLLETFVECERHRGTSYKAANWVNVGKTAGRGPRQEVPRPQADHPHQGHLALSAAKELPHRPLRVTTPHGFTEYLPRPRMAALQLVGIEQLFRLIALMPCTTITAHAVQRRNPKGRKRFRRTAEQKDE